MNVYIPRYYYNVRAFVLEQMLAKDLGLHVSLIPADGNDVIIEGLSKRLVLKDSFFISVPKNQSYIQSQYLPTSCQYFKSEFAQESIPVFYGLPQVEQDEEQITCFVDLVAMVYFFLGRWEEIASNERDEHGRFPATASYTYKARLLDYPWVDAHSQFLYRLLQQCGLIMTAKTWTYTPILTVDIDLPFRWHHPLSILSASYDALVRQRSFRIWKSYLANFLSSRFNPWDDPYFAFQEIMELTFRANIDLELCFMTGFHSDFESRYSLNNKNLKQVLEKAIKKGTRLGIHPSYRSSDNSYILGTEIEHFTSHFQQRPSFSRQHYLRYKYPDTFLELCKNNVMVDSSIYYADYPGFRCGTAKPFELFDPIRNEKVGVIEEPMVFMDVTAQKYMQLTPLEMVDLLTNQAKAIQVHGGQHRILWHNSNIRPLEWVTYWEHFQYFINQNNHQHE